jgi:hypothetical protein
MNTNRNIDESYGVDADGRYSIHGAVNCQKSTDEQVSFTYAIQ